jgi:hypothetical protein
MFGLKMYNLATLVPVSDKTKMNLDGKTRRRLQLENKISAEENDMLVWTLVEREGERQKERQREIERQRGEREWREREWREREIVERDRERER